MKLYLGTYFPRSYAESYDIATDLFKNENYKLAIHKLEEVNILDFCCGTMGYIKSNVLKEHVRKISGKQEAERFWNYPYDAIEEAVVNSVYHRDFLQHEPIEITIEPSGISILNCPGPD